MSTINTTATEALATTIERNVSLAGPDYLWEGEDGKGRFVRPRADLRGAIRFYLWTVAGGACPRCGHGVTYEESQTCHIVSRGPKLRGFVSGNLYAGHPECNERDKAYGPVIPAYMFARPELVALTWPTGAALKRDYGAAAHDAIRIGRIAHGGMVLAADGQGVLVQREREVAYVPHTSA